MTSTPAASPAAPKRLAIVGPSALSLVRHRDTLIRSVLERGHRLLCLAPDGGGGTLPALEALGVDCRALPSRPAGFSLFADRKAETKLSEIFAEWRPDAVFGYGGRPLVQAAVAARAAAVPRIVALVNGLPEKGLSQGDGFSARHFRRALEACHALVTHNSDDLKRLRSLRLIPEGLATETVPGAGVDLAHFTELPLPPLGTGLVFLMLSRLSRSRGVAEYIAAADLVKAKARGARFLLAGEPGTGGDGLAPDSFTAEGAAIEYLGLLDDVRPALAQAHVYVYPSRAEGMPRSVLQALAVGRPVITTSVPGCRETVDERVNGCLVAPGNGAALAAAMESFLKRPDLLPAMARASRSKAERRFDARDVDHRLMDLLLLH
ncbi:MAG: glycosyltransferase family 4 protein [Hyphomicrobium sp.]